MLNFLIFFAAGCEPNKRLFGIFPKWYKGVASGSSGSCTVEIDNIYDTLKIVGNVLEMLLAGAAVLAVGFIIYGGIRFITSLGDPNGIKAARDTIINAVVGLVIALVSTLVVSFIAGRF